MRDIRFLASLRKIAIAWLAIVSIADVARGEDDTLPPPPPRGEAMSLEFAVAIALENHPALRQAGAAISEGRGHAVQAGLYPNPRMDSGNPQTIGGAQSIYSVGMTQEVIRGGKRRLDVAAAQQDVARLKFEFAQRRMEVITDSRRGFISALSAQERVQILESLLVLAKGFESTSEKLFKAGQTGESDLLLLRIERRLAESAMRSAEADLLGRKRQLAAQLGTPDMPIDRLAGTLMIDLPQIDVLAASEAVATQNPKVGAARIDISRSQTLVQRARVEPIPNVTVQGGYQFTANLPHDQALVGVYFDVPVWNRNQGNIRAAQANVAEAVARRELIRNDLLKQFADALARYQMAVQQAESYRSGILPDARRSQELVRLGYERGQFDIVRLLQVQRALFQSNLEYLSALERRYDAGAEIAGLLQAESFP